MADKIEIDIHEITSYQGSATPAFLRVFASQTFINASGQTVVGGNIGDRDNWYRQAEATLSGGVVLVAPFEDDNALDPTVINGIDSGVRYNVYLVDSKGRELAEIFTDIKISDSAAITTWEELQAFSVTRPMARHSYYYDAAQIDNLFDDLSLAPDATTLVKGKVLLDTIGTDTAVATTNKVFLAIQKSVYAESYASVSAAVTAIGSNAAHLIITESETISSNLAIPATTRVSIEGTGKLVVGAGVTLTIGKMDDCGNRQVFDVSASGANVRFLSGAVEKINIRWLVSAVGDCTYAVNQALASCVANSGGRIYFPQGAWTTAGDHVVCRNLVIEGDGLETTTIAASEKCAGIFTHGANIYDVKVQNLTLDGTSKPVAGYRCAADYGDGSAGKLRFENVKFYRCTYGFQIEDTLSNEWQMAAVSFDDKCWFSGNTYGVWCNTLNNVVNSKAFFEVGASQWAGYILGAGQWDITGEFAGSAYVGDHQVETAVITAASGITVSGIATATITAALLPNSPVTVSVPLTTTEHTDATLIAAAFRKAIGADPNYTSFGHIAGTGANLEFITLDALANDLTFNVAISTGTATGITAVTNSTNTTAGVVESTQAQGFYFNNAHGTFNFIATKDEGFRNFIVSDTSDYNSVINFVGSLIQSPIKLNGNCTVNTTNCIITNRSIREASGANVRYTSRDDIVLDQSAFAGLPFRTIAARRTHNFSGLTAVGSGQILDETIPSEMRQISQLSKCIVHNEAGFFENRSRGRLEVMSSVDPSGGSNWTLLKLGRCSATGEPLFYYDFTRRYDNGRLVLAGNQTSVAGAVGLDFNGDMTAVNFRGSEISPTQITSNQNNWNPSSSAQNILVTTDASRNITGMTFDYAQNGGDVRVIWNTGSFNLVLAHQSGSSAAGNRFLNVTGADLTLLPNQGALCFFDGTARRWRTMPMSAVASSIVNTPSGTISATTVQAAIDELDSEKAPINSPTLVTPVIGVATGTSLATTGLIKSSGTAGVGYATGAGGTVTQATDKSTTVVLNKTCGTVTMNNAALAADTIVSFTMTNSTIAATDVLILNHISGGTVGAYSLNAQCGAGSAVINVRNNTSGSLGESVVIQFALIKGVTS